ncbi:MAG: acyl-CoA thioesterase [Bacteroidales bacterium]|nr:acyl-CoA thioesterase [Bacteroidales bacterium]
MAMELKATKNFTVRFNETDSMGIVWHGSYVTYFEDAREAFGMKYGFDYLTIVNQGFYVPIVDMHIEYKSMMRYGDEGRIVITFKNCDSAKIIYEYEIFNRKTGKLVAKGSTLQVFVDMNYELVISSPDFFIDWKIKNGIKNQ